MASGAIDVNHKDEVYDGKVRFPKILSLFFWFILNFYIFQFKFHLNSEHQDVCMAVCQFFLIYIIMVKSIHVGTGWNWNYGLKIQN